MPALTLDDAMKALSKKTVTTNTFSRFKIGILEELCRTFRLPVVATGKRRSQRATKDDYISAILAYRKSSTTVVGQPVPALLPVPQSFAPIPSTGADDVRMEVEACAVSASNGMVQDTGILDILPNSTDDQPCTDGIAGILPFVEETEVVQENGKDILVRLYATPRSWNPTTELIHICDADGFIDLKRLATELQDPERRVKVIHPAKLRPVYEDYPGKFLVTDAAELMEEGGLRGSTFSPFSSSRTCASNGGTLEGSFNRTNRTSERWTSQTSRGFLPPTSLCSHYDLVMKCCMGVLALKRQPAMAPRPVDDSLEGLWISDGSFKVLFSSASSRQGVLKKLGLYSHQEPIPQDMRTYSQGHEQLTSRNLSIGTSTLCVSHSRDWPRLAAHSKNLSPGHESRTHLLGHRHHMSRVRETDHTQQLTAKNLPPRLQEPIHRDVDVMGLAFERLATPSSSQQEPIPQDMSGSHSRTYPPELITQDMTYAGVVCLVFEADRTQQLTSRSLSSGTSTLYVSHDESDHAR
ncbi:hypothetical protein BKA70DRAFT_1574420 [Coprinopsis sp. MPI-PUGE-AT-0042]|nr:hypothetical protein BKA70DRAFT_1574420 [Coprinopsis sp. MPI-PUGE-AT-0042]